MGDQEIPNWLKGLPLAPEFRPTDTEFADPVAYISKIEKQASAFGICKVIPPLPRPSKKYVISNLSKSLLKCPELGVDANSVDVSSSSKRDSGNEANDGEGRAVFTTRHQELGQNAKTTKKAVQPQPPAVRMQVWQSGEIYTLEEFESKSKSFARNQLGMVKELSPLLIEALFWKAASEKPIQIEYANDVPGSGFGAPEGSFRYFHRRRRRRRTFNRNGGGSYNSMKYRVDSMTNTSKNKGESTESCTNLAKETAKECISLPTTILSHETRQFSRQKSSNASSNEMEGSAGWKLSNSPWNLQVIARSPGSLTRFMPDDIPGVTSPMVYIGMLFSWFAWHVEDHELHSMNFLHTGSPKTWYAIPGDYAFSFEEVIRKQAYGGNLDRLAALSLLGEKTTLLAPEVVVESGIPCCRLIQNPGEFVVTFPRAYHIGFSHGFNCGEAANFGTSTWLKVAKDAAVRRAVMNFLPMLSHQQLLYLLTMSFVSRVPRSLLPGARSSRLRDRQKEERELSVKKAFIEDILDENNLLAILLGKNSSYHVALWDLDSLPSPNKDSQLCSNIATVLTTTPGEAVCHEDKNNHDLFSEMSLYMERVNDLFVDDDDLSSDFQIDSGTLACVACGILGFPFMAVVQPSERASMDLLQDVAFSKPAESHCPPVFDHTVEDSVSDGLKDKIEGNESNKLNGASLIAKSIKSMVHSSEDICTSPRFYKGWSATRGFLRPRIFCLEHAIQIEEMLRSKGGANVLVICHSDFQKIKAHAASIAEEIGSPFGYNDIPLGEASQEDLNLIDLAIDDEEHDECGEDWTSKSGINLRYCVKVRKNSPSKQVQHALALGGIFSDDTSPNFNTFKLKWPSRKTRSKRNLNNSVHVKSSGIIPMEKKNEVLGTKSDGTTVRIESKLIQYSRKKFKTKRCAAERHCGGPDEHINNNVIQDIVSNTENTGKSSGLGDLGSNRDSEFVNDHGGKSVSSQTVDSLIVATSGVENVEEVPIEDNEMIVEVEASDSTRGNGSERNEQSCAENSSVSLSTEVQSTMDFDIQRDHQITEEISTIHVASVDTSEGQCSMKSDGDAMKEKDASDLINSGENIDTSIEVLDCVESMEVALKTNVVGETQSDSENSCLPEKKEVENTGFTEVSPRSNARNGSKRRREVEFDFSSFIRSPCEGLRPRAVNDAKRGKTESTVMFEEKPEAKKGKKPSDGLVSRKEKKEKGNRSNRCDLEGCRMSFHTKADLLLHKRNRCTHKGCGKIFSSHKYARLHQRVHEESRPLKCSWKGCTMSFKWAWARTEHLRVHTGERPYKCKVDSCGLTFRFVSDYSRHRRKTGHYVDSPPT